MKMLVALVFYTFTGLLLVIILGESLESQQLIADIVKFLAGGLTGYLMHDIQNGGDLN